MVVLGSARAVIQRWERGGYVAKKQWLIASESICIESSVGINWCGSIDNIGIQKAHIIHYFAKVTLICISVFARDTRGNASEGCSVNQNGTGKKKNSLLQSLSGLSGVLILVISVFASARLAEGWRHSLHTYIQSP